MVLSKCNQTLKKRGPTMDKDEVCNAPNVFTHQMELYLTNTKDAYEYWRAVATVSVGKSKTTGLCDWFWFDKQLRQLLETWNTEVDMKLDDTREHRVWQAGLFCEATAQVNTRWIAQQWIERHQLDRQFDEVKEGEVKESIE
jgi:hypothetical protein